jgi:beta-lactamase class A
MTEPSRMGSHNRSFVYGGDCRCGHPAGLNCGGYALAKPAVAPLLLKGADCMRTREALRSNGHLGAPMDINRRTVLAACPALSGPLFFSGSTSAAEAPPPQLAAYERETGGRIGVYAENIVSGARVAWRADERFVMCSTFKASLAAMVLSRVDRGEDRLDARIAYGQSDLLQYAPLAKQNLAKGALSVGEACQGAVELSDNTCANLLLARVGGPAALTHFWRLVGDGVSRLDHNEPALNDSPPGDPRDTTTPKAMAGTLRHLLLGKALGRAASERLTGWMVACKTGDNRLRGGLPRNWKIADKTGNNGADASGDIAVVWPEPDRPVLITVYTQGGTPTAVRIADAFADVGRMVAERLA